MSLLKLSTKSLNRDKIIKIFLLLFILSLGLFLRLLDLDDRPFHNDEGVNYYFIDEMYRDGVFKYSHENYHGPSYFYLTALFEYFIGENEYGHRMSAVVSSMGIILAPLFLGTLVSMRSRLFAMTFLVLSSSCLYYGRYAIHESLLVFASLSFSIFLFRWIETRERRELLWIGLFLGLLIATKETFIIYFFAAGLSALIIYGYNKIFGQLFRQYDYFLAGLLICSLVVSFLFSGFFRHPDGIRELLFGIQQWVGRGHSDTGHHKPFFYYYDVFDLTEPVAMIGLIPLLYIAIYLLFQGVRNILAIKNKSELLKLDALMSIREVMIRPIAKVEHRFVLYMFLTAIVNFFVYSYVPYKTPWLIINISAPSLFGLGVLLGSSFSFTLSLSSFGEFMQSRDKSKTFRQNSIFNGSLNFPLTLVFVPLVLYSGYYALKFNFRENALGALTPFIDPQGVYGTRNPFAYVHAYDAMVELGKDIDVYMTQYPNTKILVGTESYWPLPFYLRRHDNKLGYIASVKKPEEYTKEYQILILDPGIKLNDPNWDFKYYPMSENQNADVYFLRKR
jgi:uncharacterized protein (TIGR03663 family)